MRKRREQRLDPAAVRRLELELGIREPDMQDARDYCHARLEMVRYSSLSLEEALAELREMYASTR